MNQFVSCMVAEFSDEDRLETAKQCGLIDAWSTEIPEDLTGDFVTQPEKVTCQYCQAEFETVNPNDKDEELG